MPSEHKSYSLERSLPKHILEGQREFWTMPARLRLDDAYWGVPFGIVTGSLIAADTSIEKELPSNPNTIKRFDNLSNYGAFAFGGLVGGTYLLGRWKHNDYLKDTAWLAGEAGANGFISTFALKSILGRDRPTEGTRQGDFFNGGQSFPSEHASAAWSVATVFAERYPGILTKIAMYGGASTVSMARVIGQKHFTSDVFVGSVLGWYFGHQAVRRYEQEHAADEKWGTFVRTSEPPSRNPANMGSPYVPLDSWVYPVFDRLAAMGYINTAFLGMRPWTRMECARLLGEAQERKESEGFTDVAEDNLDSLREEFSFEVERLGGAPNLRAGIDSVYTRVMGIAGKPLTDGYHFGQTIYNDYGRPYQEGLNAIVGVSGSATAGPFAFYGRGEYQHAPSAPSLPLEARNEIGRVDGLPVPPATPYAEVNRFRAIEAYASYTFENWQLSFGKQSLWWGPGSGGALMFTNNAEPFYLVRLDRRSPYKLPGWLGNLVGPIRTQFIFGRLEGHRFLDLRPESNVVIGSWQSFVDPQPFIHATKFSLKPTSNLELSISLGAEFAGEGIPLNFHYFRRTFNNYSTGPENNGNRETGFHFSYRIPGLRNWLTLYADSMAEDEPSPIVYPRRSAMNPGIYVPRVPFLPKLDLRLEGVYTDLPNLRGTGIYYADYHFRGGWTNNSNVLGSWIGRQGSGLQGWSTYWINTADRIQLEYRYGDVSNGFIAGGGNYRDLGVNGEFFVKKKNVSVSAKIQHESWFIPVLANSREGNWSTSVQLAYWPKRRSK